MASITPTVGDEIACKFVNGGANRKRQRVLVEMENGRDGQNITLLGRGPATFQFQAVAFFITDAVDEEDDSDTPEADAETWITDVQECQGQICTIEDSRGLEWETCLVTMAGDDQNPPLKTTIVNGLRVEIILRGVQLSPAAV